MAVTKFLNKKVRLDILVNYVMNGEKTEKMLYVSGINCFPDTAIEDMKNTKIRYGKTKGIEAYHLIQSFNGKEVSPQKCHELGLQYANELFGDEYEVVVATHLNTDNIHNHIVINSVSFKSGKKFYNNRENKDFIRITSDFICKENNLSVLDTPWKYKGYYKLHAKNDPYIQLVKQDIDETILLSRSYKDFKNKLLEKGYFLEYNENTGLKVSRQNNNKVIRLYQLFGKDYSKDNIKQRIAYWDTKANKVSNKSISKRYKMSLKEYSTFINKQQRCKLSKMSAFYLLLCLLLKIDPLPKKIKLNNYSIPISKEMKISIKHMNRLSQQAILLKENNINSINDLRDYRYLLENKVKEIKGKREGLWKQKSKTHNEEDKLKIDAEISKLKTLITFYNKDIMNCYEIENRSILLKNQLYKVKNEENYIKEATLKENKKKERY